MPRKFSRDELEKFHDYEIFVPTRTIYLGSVMADVEGQESGTDAIMAEKLIKNMHFLEQLSKDPITIISNNLGGSWHHGMAIYDTIKNSPCYVTMRGCGHVMSMGSVILQAADERVLTREAVVMVHDGYEGFIGIPKSFESWGRESKRVRERMYEIYAERSGRPPEYWEEVCSKDTFMTSHQAVAEGLADRVELPGGEEE
jgi:ATP-dependent Clp protease protease subunit